MNLGAAHTAARIGLHISSAGIRTYVICNSAHRAKVDRHRTTRSPETASIDVPVEKGQRPSASWLYLSKDKYTASRPFIEALTHSSDVVSWFVLTPDKGGGFPLSNIVLAFYVCERALGLRLGALFGRSFLPDCGLTHQKGFGLSACARVCVCVCCYYIILLLHHYLEMLLPSVRRVSSH